MQPKLVFIAAAATAVLLGGAFVGSMVLLEGPAGRLGQGQGSKDLPAAAEVMTAGMAVATERRGSERVGMDMRITDEAGLEVAQVDVRYDPATFDAYVRFYFDLAALGEEDSEAMMFFPETNEPLEIEVWVKDELSILGFPAEDGTMLRYAFRDHVPNADQEAGAFPFLPFGNDEFASSAENPFSPGTLMSEMEAFLAETGNEVSYTIEAGTWEGIPSYAIHATFANATASGTGDFHFRASDYVPLHFSMDSTEDGKVTHMTVGFTYGSGVEIELPPTYTKWPVTVMGNAAVTPEQYAFEVDGHDEEVPLSDLQIHVVRIRASQDIFGSDEVLATYATFNAEELAASADGFEFHYEDNGDGLLSAGDRFWVNATGATKFGEEGNETVTLKLWDEWAEAYEGDIPAPGVAWLLLALLAPLARRRRR